VLVENFRPQTSDLSLMSSFFCLETPTEVVLHTFLYVPYFYLARTVHRFPDVPRQSSNVADV
jgi:hypothetical protein